MTRDLKKACAAEINKLLPNITGADKLEACVSCQISRPTLDKYLKGDITNIDTAIKIVGFFKGKTSQRMALLRGAA